MTIMKLKLDIDPDIVALMQAEVAAGEKAVSAAMREAGASLKSAWRGSDHRRWPRHPARQ